MKPGWDTYYLTQCFLVAQRSIDPSTKCGAVIVSKDGRVLSQGYNGPLRGSDDSKVPLTRPDKYPHMIHAEENAILSYNGSYQDIQGSTIYVTGSPCHKCMRMIRQKGIKTIVYPEFPITKCQDEADLKATELMDEYAEKVTIREVDCVGDIFHLIDQTKLYMSNKLDGYDGEDHEYKGGKPTL
jgi:dCMP deaminase